MRIPIAKTLGILHLNKPFNSLIIIIIIRWILNIISIAQSYIVIFTFWDTLPNYRSSSKYKFKQKCVTKCNIFYIVRNFDHKKKVV